MLLSNSNYRVKIKCRVTFQSTCLTRLTQLKTDKDNSKRMKCSMIGTRRTKLPYKSPKLNSTYLRFTTTKKLKPQKNRLPKRYKNYKNRCLKTRQIYGSLPSIGTSCQRVSYWKGTSGHGSRGEAMSTSEALRRNSSLQWRKSY